MTLFAQRQTLQTKKEKTEYWKMTYERVGPNELCLTDAS